jgi:WD40 repeat protein
MKTIIVMMTVIHTLLTPTYFHAFHFTPIALSGGMDKLVVAWDFYKGRATQLIDTGKMANRIFLLLVFHRKYPSHICIFFFCAKPFSLLILLAIDTPQVEVAQSKQLFNPPFVHSIAAHPSGTRMAVGLGDGSIQFLHTSTDLPTAPSLEGGMAALSVTPSASKKSKKKAASSGKGTENGWLIGGRLSDAHASPIATM